MDRGILTIFMVSFLAGFTCIVYTIYGLVT